MLLLLAILIIVVMLVCFIQLYYAGDEAGTLFSITSYLINTPRSSYRQQSNVYFSLTVNRNV